MVHAVPTCSVVKEKENSVVLSWKNRWCSVATWCCNERLGVEHPDKRKKVQQCILQSKTFPAILGLGLRPVCSLTSPPP